MDKTVIILFILYISISVLSIFFYMQYHKYCHKANVLTFVANLQNELVNNLCSNLDFNAENKEIIVKLLSEFKKKMEGGIYNV